MRIKKTLCRCGTKKTPETTAVLNRDWYQYYHYVCKKCDTDRMIKSVWSKLPISELTRIRDKHLADYNRIENYISGRLLSVERNEM